MWWFVVFCYCEIFVKVILMENFFLFIYKMKKVLFKYVIDILLLCVECKNDFERKYEWILLNLVDYQLSVYEIYCESGILLCVYLKFFLNNFLCKNILYFKVDKFVLQLNINDYGIGIQI